MNYSIFCLLQHIIPPTLYPPEVDELGRVWIIKYVEVLTIKR